MQCFLLTIHSTRQEKVHRLSDTLINFCLTEDKSNVSRGGEREGKGSEGSYNCRDSPHVQLQGIAVAFDDKLLELLVNLVNHGGEGGKLCLSQLLVVIGEGIQHPLVSLICQHLQWIVVITVSKIFLQGKATVRDRHS